MAEHSVTKMPLICIDASKNSMAAFECKLKCIFLLTTFISVCESCENL